MTKVKVLDGNAWRTLGCIPAGMAEKWKSIEQDMCLRDIARDIGRLDADGSDKEKLRSLMQKTVKVGQTIVHIGAYIVRMIIKAMRAFPTVSIALIGGWIIGMILSSIPFLGWLLAAIWAPVMLIGVGAAVVVDVLELVKKVEA